VKVLASVVVPTYRRPDLLDRCLASLTAQTFDPIGYEIIVADDADDPATLAQVARWCARTANGPRITYVPVRGMHGPAGARNAGWGVAKGEIVAFTDDDTLPCPDWLAQGTAAFDTPVGTPVAAAAGRVHVPLQSDRPSDYELDTSRLAASEFVTANCFVRRDVLCAIGGFDTRFTAPWREDSDLHFALIEAQGRIVRASGAVVVHPVRPAKFGESLRQQRKILFDALLYKKHRRLYRQRIRATPRWDYYAIVVALGLAIAAPLFASTDAAWAAWAVWLTLTARFAWRRLRDTSRAPLHVLEILLTSVLIPPLAVFWRFVGALRYRVLFI
jgi:glycosyltransferase involved in cell wall biosynthesis